MVTNAVTRQGTRADATDGRWRVCPGQGTCTASRDTDHHGEGRGRDLSRVYLTHLGHTGPTLGDQVRAARKAGLFSGIDTKLGEAVEDLVAWSRRFATRWEMSSWVPC